MTPPSAPQQPAPPIASTAPSVSVPSGPRGDPGAQLRGSVGGRRGGLVAVAGIFMAVILAGCSTGAGPPALGGAGSVGIGSALAPTGGPGGKTPLVGLIDMGPQAAYRDSQPFPTTDTSVVAPDAGAFTGIVVDETWAQLEPAAGRPDWAPLDPSLAAVTAYNQAHPATPLGVKLRIFGGYTAADWAKTLDGPPITVTAAERNKNKPGGTLGQFWKPDYLRAWSDFQHALADRYDTDPLIRMTAVASCATETDEPFIMSLTPGLVRAMTADGWTPAARRQCLTGAVGDYSGWRHTPVDYTINPFRSPDASGKISVDDAFSEQVLTGCVTSAQAGGPTCLAGNHGLQDSATSNAAAPIYATVNALAAAHPGQVSASSRPTAPAWATTAPRSRSLLPTTAAPSSSGHPPTATPATAPSPSPP